jgi:hypothetical protein
MDSNAKRGDIVRALRVVKSAAGLREIAPLRAAATGPANMADAALERVGAVLETLECQDAEAQAAVARVREILTGAPATFEMDGVEEAEPAPKKKRRSRRGETRDEKRGLDRAEE